MTQFEKTLPLSVANPGFMLDRLGMDCAPLQFLRELTQNSIEAVERTGKRGEIVWDVDWTTFDLEGRYKLSITDTGDGMTGEDLVKYINHLSSSGSIQSHFANFGVGAKIAAATKNKAGLIYLSWKEGVGSMIHLWRDPETGDYGLRMQERADGYGYWAHIENAVKPDMISDHGTKVVLIGDEPLQDTMAAPEGTGSPSRWVTRYLNTRYFQFPENISVKCREGWEFDRSDKDRNVLRTITGQRHYLDQHASHSGKVALQNAVAHWWILRKEGALTQNSGFVASSGHVAALHKNELYEMSAGRGSTAMLQNFGVIFGYQQVVIYVEPGLDESNITTDTARTRLLIGSQPLPWADWAAEFRDGMPVEIKQHMEIVAGASEASDHRDAIKERLKQIRDLFELSRYRPAPQGRFLVDGSQKAQGGEPRERDEEPKSARKRTGTEGGIAGSVYSLFITSDGEPADKVKGESFPEVRWIAASDATRTVGDLEDRAAKYIPHQNLLLINSDFRVFEDMVKRWVTQYGGIPGVEKTVREVVREWFEQSLVEAVVSSNALRGSKEWTDEQIEKLLTEEALTAVVLPRWHIEQSIKRGLGSRLGANRRAG